MRSFNIEIIRCAEDDVRTSDIPRGSTAVVSVKGDKARLHHFDGTSLRSTELRRCAAPGNFVLDDGKIAMPAKDYVVKIDGLWMSCFAHWRITLDGRALTEREDGVPYPLFVAEHRASTCADERGRYSVWQTGRDTFETRTAASTSMGALESPERAEELARRMAEAYDARTLRGPGLGPEPTRSPLQLERAESDALAAMLARRALCERFLNFAETSRAKTLTVGKATASGLVDGDHVEVELPYDVIQAALDDGSLERVTREWLAAIDVAVEATYGIAITPRAA